jgi:lysozyme family protein
MKYNYQTVQPWVLAYEGGYVNHPKDPGGATMEGVTQRTYDADRRRRGLGTRSVRQMEAWERDAIYKVQYWDAVRGDDLPSGIDAAVYDYAVNSGPGRAARELQAVLGVTQDGVIGVMTLDAAHAGNPQATIKELCERRLAFMKRARHPETKKLLWPTFKVGWTRRVMGDSPGVQDGDTGIIDRATRLARGRLHIPAPKVRNDGAGQVASDVMLGFLAQLFAAIFRRKT